MISWSSPPAVNAGASLEKWQDAAGRINLLNDIDMSSVKDWTPIGNATFAVVSNKLTVTGPMFTGRFNGQGYKIRNFKAVSKVAETGGTFGLFGVIGPDPLSRTSSSSPAARSLYSLRPRALPTA